MDMNFRHGDSIYNVQVNKAEAGFTVKIDDKEYAVDANELRPGLLQISTGDGIHKFVVSVNKDERHVFLKGGVFKLERLASLDQADIHETEGDLNSPITGKVVAVKAKDGQELEKGQTIIILEAMKMEYKIDAPCDGTVKKLHFKEGDPVEMGELLLDFEERTEGEE